MTLANPDEPRRAKAGNRSAKNARRRLNHHLCAYCGGEIYRYENVYSYRNGELHEQCFYPQMRLNSRKVRGVFGQSCEHCGEPLTDLDTITSDGALIHYDCLFEFLRNRYLPHDSYY